MNAQDGRARRSSRLKHDTHERILHAVRKMLSDGHHNITVKTIAGEARCSIGTVYNHFPGGVNAMMVSLGRQAAARSLSRVQQLLDSSGPGPALELFPVYVCEDIIALDGIPQWSLPDITDPTVPEWITQPSTPQMLDLLLLNGYGRTENTVNIARTAVYLTRGAILSYCVEMASAPTDGDRLHCASDLLASAHKVVPTAMSLFHE